RRLDARLGVLRDGPPDALEAALLVAGEEALVLLVDPDELLLPEVARLDRRDPLGGEEVLAEAPLVLLLLEPLLPLAELFLRDEPGSLDERAVERLAAD